MAIQTACPHCDQPYRAADSMAGRRVRCRHCGGVFTLQALAAASLAGSPAPAAAGASLTDASLDDTGAPLPPAKGSGTAEPPLEPGVNAAGPTGDLDPIVADAFRIHSRSSPASPRGPSAAAARFAAGPETPDLQSLAPLTIGPETPINPLDAPDLAAVDDSDAVFTQAFQDYRPAIRQNHIHNYPYAYLIDRWVPPVLIAVSIVWLILQFIFDNDTGVVWTIPVRLLLAGVCYVLIVFPIGWLGMSLGCRWARFSRPPSIGRRVVAVTLFPYVLMLVIWHLVGSLEGAIPGLLVALIVAAGLAWLLYRPAAEESAISVSTAASAFIFAMMLCTGAVLGLNEAARAIARSGKPSPDLVASPIGPGLQWDIAAAPGAPAPTALAGGDGSTSPIEDLSLLSGTQPTTHSTTQPITPSTSPAVGPAPATLPASRPALPASRPAPPAVATPKDPGDADPLDDNRLFGPKPATRPSVVSPEPGQSDPPDGPPPDKPPPALVKTGDPVADGIIDRGSPLVTGVSALKKIEPFERAVFPLTPSPHVLLVRPTTASGDAADAIEVWDLSASKRVAARIVAVDDTDDPLYGNYALSPTGTLVARIGSFPTLGVDLISLHDTPAPPRVAFATTYGRPRVAGFAGADHLLIRWEDDDHPCLQVLDLTTGVLAKGLDLPKNAWSPFNRAASADGRFYAVVGEAAGSQIPPQAELAIVDLGGNTVRRVPIHGVDPQWALDPTGVAFSNDGKTIGILYERGGQSAVLWMAVEGKQLQAYLVPAGMTPPAPHGLRPATGRLASIAGGKFWLIAGNAVLDAQTGKTIGELGVPATVGQRLVGDSVALVREMDGPRKLVRVELATVLAAKSPTTQPTAGDD